jgi:large conductance mechanosensitive channel
MGILHEFKSFAIKGNVIDLAIGVVIGAAFSKIVSSLVDDIITPAVLTPALKAARLSDLNQLVIPGTAIKYGNFISTLISFLIIAFVLFLIVKAINRANRKAAAESPPPAFTPTELLLIEIRDLLKSRNT